MNTYLWGSHAVLSTVPVWASALVLVFVTIIALLPARELLEGMSYNISMASQVGDLGLIGIILIGQTILQSMEAAHSQVLGHALYCFWGFHVLVFGIAAVVALMLYQMRNRMGKLAHAMDFSFGYYQTVDKYHDIFIVPLFIYLCLTMSPFVYYFGNPIEKIAATVCCAIWFVCLAFDALTGRLHQRRWLHETGSIHFDR
jgi:hypothetical protein